jgi:hypothetical protein
MDNIVIHTLKMNGLEYGASVGIGPVVTVGVQTSAKACTGNGSISGDHGYIPTLFGLIYDPDLIDTPEWRWSSPPWT